MVESTDNLVLELLRAIRTDIAALREDSREIKSRLTSVELGIGSLKRDAAHQYTDISEQHSRYDRLVDRIDIIEKRLNISSG